MRRLSLAVIASVLSLAGAGRALAASSAAVHIDVMIAATLSVEIDAGGASTHTVNWVASSGNQVFANTGSSVTVRNDSGGLTEKWALSAAPSSINQGGGLDNWTLAASTAAVGPDQFALQAVFGSSRTAVAGCLSPSSPDWNESYAAPLTAFPVNYTSTMFAGLNLTNDGTPLPDITAGAADGRMHAGSQRALCWRLITPSSTATTQTQSVQIIVTAALP